MNHLHFLDNQKRLDRLDRRRLSEGAHPLLILALILSALLLAAALDAALPRHDVPVNAVTR